MGKSVVEINFTEKKKSNSLVKKLIKQKQKIKVKVTDYIYPLTNLNKNKYKIKDHINLSGHNPLKGAQFIPLTNVYTSKKGIVVAGLKEGIKPTEKEKKVLLKAGVKAYCYNLVPAVIYLASLKHKVDAVGIVEIRGKEKCK